jgi:hypothetical protein
MHEKLVGHARPTFAPLFASSNAKPAPMPREAPVTMATLSWRGRAVEFDEVMMSVYCGVGTDLIVQVLSTELEINCGRLCSFDEAKYN